MLTQSIIYKISTTVRIFALVMKRTQIHLRADLVAALASLDVHDFTHFALIFCNVSHNSK